jgi:hypothetical protein
MTRAGAPTVFVIDDDAAVRMAEQLKLPPSSSVLLAQ